jgi:O-antigen ligase
MEQSGRERLWPAAVERIFTAPLVGVGISDATMDIMPPKRSPPHNSFLYFALASGVIPLALWVAFWIQALRRSLAASETEEAAAFRIPFLLYTFTIVMLGDLGFTSPWALIALSAVACPRASYRASGLLRLPGTGDGLTRPRALPHARTRHWTPVN